MVLTITPVGDLFTYLAIETGQWTQDGDIGDAQGEEGIIG
jgi:hypothetical protein